MNPKLVQTESLPAAPQSFFFTFRLWQTRGADGDDAWRGRLESVTTGQVRYLNDLQGVEAHLRALLGQLEQDGHLMEDNNA